MNSTGNTVDGGASVGPVDASGPSLVVVAAANASVNDGPDNGANGNAMDNEDSDELFPNLDQEAQR